MKHGPLSDTIGMGNPLVAKVINSFYIVTDAVLELVICTSIHLECASTNINNLLSLIGPA